MVEGPCEDSINWTGSCIFRESWSTTSEEIHQIDRAADIPGSLVFTNIPEYSLVDDLSGDSLPAPLVTLAKREESTEMYRRKVWVEKSVGNACEIWVSPQSLFVGSLPTRGTACTRTLDAGWLQSILQPSMAEKIWRISSRRCRPPNSSRFCW